MNNRPYPMSYNRSCASNPAAGCNMNRTNTPNSNSISQRDCMDTIPVNNRKALLRYIDEASFSVYETLLYLDTHPTDDEAMRFFSKHNQRYTAAMQEYAKRYGPLTVNTADDCSSQCWEWMNQPWPWEGGES